MAFCLIVEDDVEQGRIVAATLRSAGHETMRASNGAAAVEAAALRRPEVVLLDLGLPDTDGLDLIPRILAASPLSRIVVLTGRDSVAAAVAALRSGARHYLLKPWEQDELLLVIEREGAAVDHLESAGRDAAGAVFWGRHAGVREVRRKLAKLAEAPFTPVLLEGETGVGKEVLARELHRLSGAAGPFVALNCAALPGELLESELFGHERGAFTGADSRHRGVVELARDGTLLLDEVGEMPPPLQAKLLRFLDGHRFRRVGGEEELASPCRVVAATNRDLERAQLDGAFRPDLFFRLAVVRLRLAPLRERREDVVPLANFLVGELARSLGRRPRPFSPAAESALAAHDWPGNVRELRNRIERALVLGEEPAILPSDLDLPRRLGGTPAAIEEPRVSEALAAEGWNVARAARRLGVPRHWLRYQIRKRGLHRSE
jgi:two-component system, NtrC family, response regulator AtoC